MIPTRYGVPALIGIGLLVATFAIFGLKVGLALTLLLVYEAWTLTNSEKADTISETIWKLCARPLVPFLFGMAYGYALATGLLNEYTSGVAAFLLAHFVFQANMVYEYYSSKE